MQRFGSDNEHTSFPFGYAYHTVFLFAAVVYMYCRMQRFGSDKEHTSFPVLVLFTVFLFTALVFILPYAAFWL
jgi:hypothetical protein